MQEVEFYSKLAVGMFLYFPEDKSEYIPAAITFFIVLLLALLTMFLITKHSKKEEAKYKQMEAKTLRKEQRNRRK